MNNDPHTKLGDQDKGYRLFQKIIIYLTFIALLPGVYGCSTKTPIPGRKNEDVLETTEISRNIAAFHINSLEVDEKHLYINSSAEYEIKYKGKRTWDEETKVASPSLLLISLCPLWIVLSPVFIFSAGIKDGIGGVGGLCAGGPKIEIEREKKFGDVGEKTKRKTIPYSGFVNIFGERNNNYTTTSKDGVASVYLSQLPSSGRIFIEIKNNDKQIGKEISINAINKHVQELISTNAIAKENNNRKREKRESCLDKCARIDDQIERCRDKTEIIDDGYNKILEKMGETPYFNHQWQCDGLEKKNKSCISNCYGFTEEIKRIEIK